MRWANGGGTTREVVALPGSAAWIWRLSIANVAADGPFSSLPGVHRTIALLRGNGFVLRVDGAAPESIIEPYRPFRFDGGAGTVCELIDGPVVDLNLMERGPQRTLDLGVTRLTAGAACTVARAVAVLVVAGQVAITGDVLDVLDAAVCAATSPDAQTFTAGAAGAVLAVVEIRPLSTGGVG